VTELERAMWEFIDVHNDEPKLCVDETADEILDEHRPLDAAHISGTWAMTSLANHCYSTLASIGKLRDSGAFE